MLILFLLLLLIWTFSSFIPIPTIPIPAKIPKAARNFFSFDFLGSLFLLLLFGLELFLKLLFMVYTPYFLKKITKVNENTIKQHICYKYVDNKLSLVS